MSVLIVSGTGTDVGKTVATAALAACARGRVAVVKPVQTGVADGAPGDLAEVTRLSKITNTYEFRRYPDPLSPHQAARRCGRDRLALADAVRAIGDLDTLHDTVLVEGAGGLLVSYGDWTLIDLASALHAPVLVVTLPGLGTLNHTALTVDRLAEEFVSLAGIVIGRWPADPDLAMRCNLDDLGAMGPVEGVLPDGMATMRDFPTRARAALAAGLGGTFDWLGFKGAT